MAVLAQSLWPWVVVAVAMLCCGLAMSPGGGGSEDDGALWGGYGALSLVSVVNI